MGGWSATASQRDSVIFSFPRASGAHVLHLPAAVALGSDGEAEGPARQVIKAMGINAHSPLPAGSLLYCPPRLAVDEKGRRVMGCLHLLLTSWSGEGLPACAHLHDGGTAAAAKRFAAGGRVPLLLDGASLDGTRPWFPDPGTLWLVNHLGEACLVDVIVDGHLRCKPNLFFMLAPQLF